jgi:hypothetical protein
MLKLKKHLILSINLKRIINTLNSLDQVKERCWSQKGLSWKITFRLKETGLKAEESP